MYEGGIHFLNITFVSTPSLRQNLQHVWCLFTSHILKNRLATRTQTERRMKLKRQNDLSESLSLCKWRSVSQSVSQSVRPSVRIPDDVNDVASTLPLCVVWHFLITWCQRHTQLNIATATDMANPWALIPWRIFHRFVAFVHLVSKFSFLWILLFTTLLMIVKNRDNSV